MCVTDRPLVSCAAHRVAAEASALCDTEALVRGHILKDDIFRSLRKFEILWWIQILAMLIEVLCTQSL